MRNSKRLYLVLTVCSVAACGTPRSPPPSTWRDDVRRTYESEYFKDVTNLLIPQGSNLGLCLAARAADYTGTGRLSLLAAIHYSTAKIFINPGDGKRFRDESLARLPQHDRASEEMVVGHFSGTPALDVIISSD